MERARHDEGNEDRAQPLPPGGQTGPRLTPEPITLGDPAEELLDLEALDTPTTPGYLTLEIDVQDLQAFAADIGTSPRQPDWWGQEHQEPEVAAELDIPELHDELDISELYDLEEESSPGYLTLEIDRSALENESHSGQEEQ